MIPKTRTRYEQQTPRSETSALECLPSKASASLYLLVLPPSHLPRQRSFQPIAPNSIILPPSPTQPPPLRPQLLPEMPQQHLLPLFRLLFLIRPRVLLHDFLRGLALLHPAVALVDAADEAVE